VKKKTKPKRQKSDEFVIERSSIGPKFNPTNLCIANCSSGDIINIYNPIILLFIEFFTSHQKLEKLYFQTAKLMANKLGAAML
jgi:hypothetical protein